jgi:uncharacterized membrane protein YfcA
MSESPETYFWLCLSALAAGAVNALAGGGTLLTFPALLSVVPEVTANVTSTVALVPGSLGGVWGFGREVRGVWRWIALLTAPSLLGGLIGAVLLTRLDPSYFTVLVPWLILTATLLLLLRPVLARRAVKDALAGPPSARALAAAVGFQFLVAVYGGYFGAGIGILMLSALGLMGLGNIHQMNAVKNFLALCINGISVVVFAADGRVVWHLAGVMAVSAVLGGYLSASIARRVNPAVIRWLVVGIGFSLTAYFFFQQWRVPSD